MDKDHVGKKAGILGSPDNESSPLGRIPPQGPQPSWAPVCPLPRMPRYWGIKRQHPDSSPHQRGLHIPAITHLQHHRAFYTEAKNLGIFRILPPPFPLRQCLHAHCANSDEPNSKDNQCIVAHKTPFLHEDQFWGQGFDLKFFLQFLFRLHVPCPGTAHQMAPQLHMTVRNLPQRPPPPNFGAITSPLASVFLSFGLGPQLTSVDDAKNHLVLGYVSL